MRRRCAPERPACGRPLWGNSAYFGWFVCYDPRRSIGRSYRCRREWRRRRKWCVCAMALAGDRRAGPIDPPPDPPLVQPPHPQEVHLQAVMREQQDSSSFSSKSVIPIPSIETLPMSEYKQQGNSVFQLPSGYMSTPVFTFEEDKMEYALDSDDEAMLAANKAKPSSQRCAAVAAGACVLPMSSPQSRPAG